MLARFFSYKIIKYKVKLGLTNSKVWPISAYGPGAPGAARVGPREDVPGVVGGWTQQRLPGRVAPVVPGLHIDFPVGVVLMHGLRVRALLCLALVEVVRVGGINHLVPLLPVQQEALQRHRVLLRQKEGGLRQVLTRWEHLSGALQVEQDTCPGGVVHITVVLQEPVVEQTVVSEAGGLRKRGQRENIKLQHGNKTCKIMSLIN